MITGSTRVFAILGNPVAHSLSPVMHNAAFHTLGIQAVYVPLACTAEDVPALIRALVRAGGGGNVTVPFKEAAARAVDVCRDRAEVVGAGNTFWGENGRSVGDNTDVQGVLEALRQLDAPEAPWLIAGTGGAARAATIAARERGVAVAVRSRDEGRRREFERWMSSRGVDLATAPECRVLINATPLGLKADDPLPISPAVAPRAEVALDMVYRAGETAWIRDVRSRVRRAADGRAMLVAQGAAAFECWFPGKRAPTEVMRAAVNAALRS
ncbi:MAG: shikimate dehydrogenase [Gemmatimonadales bacterium]